MDRSTVSRLANSFRGSRMSIDNVLRSERQKTSTDVRSVKLVADALDEDRHATSEELSVATGAKTS